MEGKMVWHSIDLLVLGLFDLWEFFFAWKLLWRDCLQFILGRNWKINILDLRRTWIHKSFIEKLCIEIILVDILNKIIYRSLFILRVNYSTLPLHNNRTFLKTFCFISRFIHTILIFVFIIFTQNKFSQFKTQQIRQTPGNQWKLETFLDKFGKKIQRNSAQTHLAFGTEKICLLEIFYSSLLLTLSIKWNKAWCRNVNFCVGKRFWSIP